MVLPSLIVPSQVHLFVELLTVDVNQQTEHSMLGDMQPYGHMWPLQAGKAGLLWGAPQLCCSSCSALHRSGDLQI